MTFLIILLVVLLRLPHTIPMDMHLLPLPMDTLLQPQASLVFPCPMVITSHPLNLLKTIHMYPRDPRFTHKPTKTVVIDYIIINIIKDYTL